MKPKPSKRLTLGYITDILESRYQQRVIPGIKAGAEAEDANLIILPGKTHNWAGFDHQNTVIYEFIHRYNLDGIVVASGALAATMDQAEVETFVRNLPVPVVSISIGFSGIPSILVTNKTGMKEAVNHLIHEHNYQRIAFVRGPETNPEAEERFQAYLECLSDHGIPADFSYISGGDFTKPAGILAMKRFLEERQLKPDAVVTANDDMATGVVKYCHQNGIRIPEDIALVGFDDIEESHYTIPPLSSVRQPLFEQARTAVETLIGSIRGHKTDERAVLPTHFVARSSCGCLPETVLKMSAREFTPPVELSTAPRQNRTGFLVRDVQALLPDPVQQQEAGEWIQSHLGPLLDSELKEFDLQKSLEAFHRYLIQDLRSNRSVDIWQNALTLMANYFLACVQDPAALDHVTLLFSGARLLIGGIQELSQGAQRYELWSNMEWFHYLIQKLINRVSIDSLLKIIIEELPSLVPGFYLFLYEREWEHVRGHDWTIPDSARFMVGYDAKGPILPDETNQYIHREDFIPFFMFPRDRRYTMILKPLYFRDKQFGFIYSEMGDQESIVYEIVRLQISTVLHASLLVSSEQIAELELLESNIKLTETNRRLEDLDRAKTAFFSNVSHELRTPLTLILGPVESILSGDRGPSVDSRDEMIRSIYHNAQRLLKLINNLLDFSRIEAGKMKLNIRRHDMNQLIRFYHSIIRSAAESRGLKIEFDARTVDLVACIDRDLFEKAFFNLISNALKFTPQGGLVRIVLERGDDPRVFSLSIQDTGAGIPKEKLDRLFERYGSNDPGSNRKYEGTGIGLSFAKEIVELHQGRLAVQSEPGRGSTFTMMIPLECETPLQNEVIRTLPEIKDYLLSDLVLSGNKQERPDGADGRSTGEEGPEESRRKKILMVDDNPDMCRFVRNLLGAEYQVILADNGRAAFQKAREHRPDLIMTDIIMPEADGHELARMVKSDHDLRNTPVIFLTAKTELDMKIEALEYGADDYIAKPFNARELTARVRNILKGRELEQELIAKQKQIDADFLQASLVQKSILTPSSVFKSIPELEMDVQFLPLNGTISGDYYNISRIRNGIASILLTDTTGHGVQAALSTMQIDLLNKESQDMKYPDERLEYINKKLTDRQPSRNLFTGFLVNILPDRIYFSSASHPEQYLLRGRRTIIPLTTHGKIIGMDSATGFEMREEKIQGGDILFLFTDGAFEEFNPSGRTFGTESIEKYLRHEIEDESPEIINRNFLKKLESYRAGTPRNDDITLICVRFR